MMELGQLEFRPELIHSNYVAIITLNFKYLLHIHCHPDLRALQSSMTVMIPVISLIQIAQVDLTLCGQTRFILYMITIPVFTLIIQLAIMVQSQFMVPANHLGLVIQLTANGPLCQMARVQLVSSMILTISGHFMQYRMQTLICTITMPYNYKQQMDLVMLQTLCVHLSSMIIITLLTTPILLLLQ